VEKSLLRDAMGDYLPATIRNRKKSPFPKAHSPQYEACIRQMLLDRLAKDGSPLASLLRPHALGELMRGDDITWLGQLMGRPQLYAWLYQMDFWLESYGIELV
jgi:asparagine synthase (glutamine-hydrolysing)